MKAKEMIVGLIGLYGAYKFGTLIGKIEACIDIMCSVHEDSQEEEKGEEKL